LVLVLTIVVVALDLLLDKVTVTILVVSVAVGVHTTRRRLGISTAGTTGTLGQLVAARAAAHETITAVDLTNDAVSTLLVVASLVLWLDAANTGLTVLEFAATVLADTGGLFVALVLATPAGVVETNVAVLHLGSVTVVRGGHSCSSDDKSNSKERTHVEE
jgi:hypothetical protein